MSLLASLVLSALTLLCWTMVWFIATVTSTGAAIEVGGDVAAPALAALGLAGMALVAALALAGPVFRVILGALEAVLGACVAWSALSAVLAPVAASASLVTEATGVTGANSVERLVDSVVVTPWPVVAVVIGALSVLVGVFIVVTARRWPQSSRKYQAVRFEAVDEPRTDAADWDSLSDGSDPTSR